MPSVTCRVVLELAALGVAAPDANVTIRWLPESCLQARITRGRHHFISSMICFSSAGISGIGSSLELHPAVGALARTTMLNLPKPASLLGIVVAEVAAAALLALERRARDGLGDRQQVVQVQRGVPAGVVLAVARDRRRFAARFSKLAESPQGLLHFLFARTMPTRSCIIVLQVLLDLVRPLGRSARSNGRQRHRPPASTCSRVELRPRACSLANFAGVLARALAEHEQVGERIAAQPIGAVEAGGALAGRRTGPARVDIWVSASTRTPPMM